MRVVVLFLLLCVSACGFSPLYSNTQNNTVCVTSIPEHDGYLLYQELTSRFTGKSDCAYTLKVETPKFSFSDAGISDHSFTTLQSINASVSYELLNKKHKTVLSSSASSDGSSAIINNPYASVVAREKNQSELLKILAKKIETHVSTFLLKDSQ